jgi:hypothetical protein
MKQRTYLEGGQRRKALGFKMEFVEKLNYYE